jgi:hypothetical protein
VLVDYQQQLEEEDDDASQPSEKHEIPMDLTRLQLQMVG